jgi:hypothetical protein
MPLTKHDELTCHQTVSTFDHPDTSDRAWTEKLWCNVHDTTGKLVLATGLGVYPNRNVMDGYGCVNIDNTRQHNVRVSRELRPRIDELTVGPLAYEVLEPFRRIRVALGENAHGLSYDLEFLGAFQPGEEQPHFGRMHGRTFVHSCRYAQSGRARGWVKVGGERYTIDESTSFAQRDHSWGIRLGVGAPEQGVQAQDISTFTGMLINWLTFQLADRAFSFYLIERADGTIERLTGWMLPRLESASRPVEITGVEHDFQYHERSARMRSGRMVFHCADGSRHELALRELTTMYLRGGGYAGTKGYTHGLWMGPSWEDGEVWEVGDRKVADEVHGLDDTVVEVRCGDEVGYGIIENMILPPFPKYGFGPPRR